MQIRDVVKCDLCGRRTEGVEIKKRLFGIIPVRFRLCQGCVSRVFRRFKRGN